MRPTVFTILRHLAHVKLQYDVMWWHCQLCCGGRVCLHDITGAKCDVTMMSWVSCNFYQNEHILLYEILLFSYFRLCHAIITFSSTFMHFTMYSTSYRFSCSDKDLFYAGVVHKPFPPVFDHLWYTYRKSSRLEVGMAWKWGYWRLMTIQYIYNLVPGSPLFLY